MERREESLTAEPQKESLSDSKDGQPRDNTSVAVSESAQQKDCEVVSIPPYNKKIRWDRDQGAKHARSNSFNPFAAFVKYTIALSVKYVQSAKINLSNRANL